MDDIIKRATIFAMEKFKGVKDDNGESYFHAHLLPVRNMVENISDEENVICASVLHDVLEDTETTYEELVKEFGNLIADLVMEVTQDGKADNHGFFFPRLKSADAIMIKFCDRASNISRMQGWNEKRRAHYLKKSRFWKNE